MYFSSFLSSTVVPLIDCQFQCKCSVLVMTESIINSLCNIPDFRALYIDDFIALFQHLDFLAMDINKARILEIFLDEVQKKGISCYSDQGAY